MTAIDAAPRRISATNASEIPTRLGTITSSAASAPGHDPPAPSTQLAAEWKPYIETCIEAFGASRSMFESNFPVDKVSYRNTWGTDIGFSVPEPLWPG